MIVPAGVLRLAVVEENMKPTLASMAISTLFAALSIAQPPRYTITDLGPLGAPPGQPFFITSNGLISGAAVGADGTSHGVLWYKGAETDLGTLGLRVSNSLAYGVNDNGTVVGMAETWTTDPYQEDFCGFKAFGLPSWGTECLPFVWQNGVMTPLPTLGGYNGQASMINNQGQIAGTAENTARDPACPAPQVLQFKPVMWDKGKIQELATVGGDPDGFAVAINDSGQVAGGSGTCTTFNQGTLNSLQPLHALLWQNGTVTDLGSLGGTGHGSGNLALGINNQGQAVGTSDLPGDKTSHAFLWTKGKGMQDLGTLPGDVFSVGVAIDDSSNVSGLSIDATGNIRAFLWQNDVMNDLNSLIPAESSLFLLLACSINPRGQIVGLAVDGAGELHGYMATPATGPSAAEGRLGVTSPVFLSDAVRRQILERVRLGRLAEVILGGRSKE
jgi:probable HAF family extracellular repeat protein